MKILAIQFRYLGDAVLLTPGLRAIREHFPGCALHVLVAEEVAPLLPHLPSLARVWAFLRRRGKAKPALSWPVFGALQAGNCTCGEATAIYLSATPCMAAMFPEAVLRLLLEARPAA